MTAGDDVGVVLHCNILVTCNTIQHRAVATGGTTMRYGIIRGIIEAGNCVYCGKHIDDGGHIFLCEECRRKEEERGCLHGKQKEEAIAMERLEKPIMVKEPRRKPTDKEER